MRKEIILFLKFLYFYFRLCQSFY